MKNKTSSGQSLLEVMVALGMSVLVLTSLVAVVVISIRNARFAKNQSLATKYAQEGIEKMRIYRDQVDNWATFKANCQNENVIGFTSVPSSFTASIDECVEAGNPERVRITIKVSWTESNKTHKSQLTTYLTEWE